jgi:proteasome lid subunit RPN8/RPN11
MSEEEPSDIIDLKKKLKAEMYQKLRNEIKKEVLLEIYDELKEEEKETIQNKIIHVQHEQESTAADLGPKLPSKVEPVKAHKKTEKIHMKIKPVMKIVSHALKYANANVPKEYWVEVIGLLSGKYDEKNDLLTLEDAYPMGHGNAVYAEIKDYKNFYKAYKDLNSKGQFICGWYHSHPSYGLFLSQEDMGTQARYQKFWDKSIALVIDPTQLDGTTLGFNIFRANLKKQKWFKVPFSLEGNLEAKSLPGLVDFVNPIIEGKEIFLEYDESSGG